MRLQKHLQTSILTNTGRTNLTNVAKRKGSTMPEQEARIYFVMDSKTDKPRMRIEDGKFYPDGTWHSWCQLEYLIPDTFMELCYRYWENRENAG